ncbi:MAG: hypothetical protein HGA37_06250 [Lentimicrobium sp.]|nr:hypothetical protein [Lentimicrobium sp.]
MPADKKHDAERSAIQIAIGTGDEFTKYIEERLRLRLSTFYDGTWISVFQTETPAQSLLQQG